MTDTYGGLGDVTGQDTYDMFNMPLSNALAGTIDPVTGLDACPISAQATADPTQAGITGMIVTCPKFEQDGHTLSPLAGQFVVANLMPEKFSVQAYPGADRIARGEQWLQTNTLDGQHPHDSFIRIGEPGYFQEYGPAGYHVAIGFANPAIINARHDAVCAGAIGAVGPCTGTVKGQVDLQRMSRTPDQRLYPSGSRDGFIWTQCWVSLGDPDGEDFMFTKCDANGNFQFTNVPGGNWRLTVGQQGWHLGARPRRDRDSVGLYEDSLPRWAQLQQSDDGLQWRCQLQRDLPAVQLVCHRSGLRPLQYHPAAHWFPR